MTERLGKNEIKILKLAYTRSKRPQRGFGITTSDLKSIMDNPSRVPLKSLTRKGYLKKLGHWANWDITEKGKIKVTELATKR